jgi:putative endonuclease
MLGQDGEQLAVSYLEAQGYHILERNWRCEVGEADIIGIHQNELVIIEVKTRRGNNALERGLEAITPRKQARLIALAEAYQAKVERDIVGLRIDVLIISINQQGTVINLYENAVGW